MDGLEDKSTSLIGALRPGQNPIALTVSLNTELPEKYRQPSNDLADATKEALGRWTAVARSMLARAQVTEPQAPRAIDVASRELPAEGPALPVGEAEPEALPLNPPARLGGTGEEG